MTAPVLNYIQPGAGPNCNSTFTVSFFVPWLYQTEEGPPKPTSDDVFVEEKKVSGWGGGWGLSRSVEGRTRPKTATGAQG